MKVYDFVCVISTGEFGSVHSKFQLGIEPNGYTGWFCFMELTSRREPAHKKIKIRDTARWQNWTVKRLFDIKVHGQSRQPAFREIQLLMH